MAQILEISLKVAIEPQETAAFLARLAENSVSSVSVSGQPVNIAASTAPTASVAAVTMPSMPGLPVIAAAPTAPAETAEAPKKGRGRPKKDASAAPTASVAAVTMPSMPGLPVIAAAPTAPAPVSIETMLGAYNAAVTAGKLTNEMVAAKYAEFGVSHPNDLQNDESKRRAMHGWLISL